MKERFTARVRLPVSAREAFDWHARPGAFERLAPPWDHVRVLSRSGTIHDGDRVTFRIGAFRWTAVHRDFVAGVQFRDVQERGPFTSWVHTHRFVPEGEQACFLEDEIEFALPVGGRIARPRLERSFRHRHRVLVHDLSRQAGARERLRIAVTGASGLLGSQLVPFLTTGGHEVVPLVRRAARPGEISWDPAGGRIDRAALEGFDAVVHLAGESVGARWTASRKRRILDSRVAGTQLLAKALAGLERPPRVLLSASAIGYYGARDARAFDEHDGPGDDFLARVCVAWEEAAEPARERGIRVVHPRMGVVLTPSGGALAKLLTPFSLGLGGRVGSGEQPMSWVSIDDTIAALHRCLIDPALAGPVNVSAPNPVSNADFAAALGRALGRPALLPLPAPVVRALFGEMGEVVLLGGARVVPKLLLDRGFWFGAPDLDTALAQLFGSPQRAIAPRLRTAER